MHLLYVGPSGFPAGGSAGRCMHMLARGLVEAGNDVDVVVIGRADDRSVEYLDGVRVFRYGRDPVGQGGFLGNVHKVWSRISYACNVCRVIANGSYDWVIVYSGGSEAMTPTALCAAKGGARVAVQYGDVLERSAATFLRYHDMQMSQAIGFRFANLIVNSGSAELGGDLRCRARGVPVVRVPPPVDSNVFSRANPGDIRKRIGVGALDRLVTYIGGLKSYEGVNLLIDAMRSVVREDRRVHLVIAGGAVERDLMRLQRYARSRCGSQVRFPGMLGMQDVARLLVASSVVVLPKTGARINRNAHPIKLGEYMASGTPVVAASVGAVTDYVEHGVNGLLFEPGDERALRAGIRLLLEDGQLACRVGEQAKADAIAQLDYAVVGRGFHQALTNGSQSR